MLSSQFHTERKMQHNPVGWFEIYVKDMDRAVKFYETVLATKLEKLEQTGPGILDMRAFPMQREGTGAAGALAKMENGPSAGNGTIVYFTCADCAVEAKRAPASGGRIMKEKFAIGPYGYIAIVTDPDGNAIGLHSMQ
jgi:predicted enzyme related to lactoylglutathione lyase